MAWNPSPKVQDLREFGRKWGYDQVVLLALNTETEAFETVSFGKTKQLCDAANLIRQHIHKEVELGIIP